MSGNRFAFRACGLMFVLGLTFAGATIAAAQETQQASPPAEPAKIPGYNAYRPEAKNMDLVGYNDLQGRSAYQPVIQKQGDRWIAYIGHHGGNILNPLTGVVEPNGTSVVDVTDVKNPKYIAHIPGEPGPGAEMVRVCNGSELPHADKSKVYMLRSYGATAHEVWDVTNPAKPTRVVVVVNGLRETHKSWWECYTGIAYIVGGKAGWRTPRMAMIYDLSDPAHPVFIRDFGLPGHQPGATGPPPADLHGPISLGVKANRIYFGYGTRVDGVLQIVDREKLLTGPKEPTNENLLYPQISRLDFPHYVGAHTVFPLIGVKLPEFAHNKDADQLHDYIIAVGEAGARECQEVRQYLKVIDITEEKRPLGVATWTVPEESGHFCERGGSFGTHATSESFSPIFYKRLIFVSHFNAGVRALDISDPTQPKEVAYYIPGITEKTSKSCVGQGAAQKCKLAIQTNNVEVDDRGYIYIVDVANTGMHILQLTGAARQLEKLP